MRERIVFWVLIVVCAGVGMGASVAVKTCFSVGSEERRVEHESLILSEKETDYWVVVYSAAVRRGARSPAEIANRAIIELRAMHGERNNYPAALIK